MFAAEVGLPAGLQEAAARVALHGDPALLREARSEEKRKRVEKVWAGAR